jgi:hypothetical protein
MSSQALSSGGKKGAAVLLCRTMRRLQELCAEVAPRVPCISYAPGIVASVFVREAQCARWSLCLLRAGGVRGRGNHASAGSDIVMWPKALQSQEVLGGLASP